MKLLITGGCGFLGSNLSAHALDRGDDLIVFDNLCREGAVNNLGWLKGQGRFRFVHGDIRSENDITHTIKNAKPDAVFHAAGQVAMMSSIANPRMDFEVNAVGTFNLLEAVRIHSPDTAVIYSSTNKVYGNLEQFTYRETASRFECIDKPDGFDEDTPLNFHSPYGCSKGAADQYMLDHARMFGLKTVVFRHSSMYGGRQYATYDQGWVGWFCKKIMEAKLGLAAEPFTISGSGKQVRDVLYADDMVRLYFKTIDNIKQARGLVFNIGGGINNSLSLLELFSLLSEITRMEPNYVKLSPRESDQRVFVADISRARRIIGWEPHITSYEGINRMVEWVSGTIKK